MNDTDDTTENDVMNVFAVYQHAHLLGSKIKYVFISIPSYNFYLKFLAKNRWKK